MKAVEFAKAGVAGARATRREGWGPAIPAVAVNWNFENFCRIVFTLNFVMWVKVKLEFSSVCAFRFTQLLNFSFKFVLSIFVSCLPNVSRLSTLIRI